MGSVEPIRGHRRGARWRNITYGVHREAAPEPSLEHPPFWKEADLEGWQLLLTDHGCITGLTALEAHGIPLPPLPDDVAIAAFRVVQEAVTNVLRHGGAQRVEVVLGYDSGRLDLAVVDDGRGFDVAAAFERAGSGRHLGLLGMRERVEAMGGSLAVESRPGSGTRLTASLPLEDGGTA